MSDRPIGAPEPELTRDELALLRAGATPEARRASTRARLMARAAADVGTAPAPRSVPLHLQRPVGRRAVWVLGGLLAASVLLLVRTRTEGDALRERFAAAEQGTLRRIDSLETALAQREELVASLTGPDVRVVGLNAGATKAPRALMFWDKKGDRWTFVAHDLPALGRGRTYQLWLVTADRKISAGTFSVSPTGEALLQATYALDRGALKAVAVTEEPEGGVPQPTGAMVVVGTLAAQ